MRLWPMATWKARRGEERASKGVWLLLLVLAMVAAALVIGWLAS